MMSLKYIWRYSGYLLLLLTCSCHASAQDISFTAQVSATKIGVKDQVQVTYTITNANIQRVDPLDLKSFIQINETPFQSTSSSVVITNNRPVQSSSISLIYILQPRHTGNLVIPALTARDNAGRSYQSNTVQIQVVNGSLAAQQPQKQYNPDPFEDDPFDDPFMAMQRRHQQQLQQLQRQLQQPGQAPQTTTDGTINISKDLFIKVSVDKNKVHIGEQITASYKLYSRIPMQVGISKLPSLNGFWTQDFDIPKTPKPEEEIIDGKKYQVFLLKKSALFPQQSGMLELDPAEAQGIARIVQQVRQHNPLADRLDNDPTFRNAFGSLMMNDPFFNNSFFSTWAYKDVPVHLKSTPVKISVVPLPEDNKPQDFLGAVGSFTLSSKVNKNTLTTDDALTLTLTITGSGNLKLIEAPKIDLPNGLDTYDPVVIDTITGRSSTITGSKIITYTITPHTPGDYELPAIPFSYYNPQSGTYVHLQTQPIKIQVKKGAHYNNPDIKTAAALSDIHNIIKQPLDELVFNKQPIFFKAGYWSLYILPLFAFIGIIAWKRREDELSRNTVKLRHKRANKVALKRLSAAQKFLQKHDKKPFYEEISKAIWLYLSDKLNIPLSALSHESAHAALTAHKIPEDLYQRVEKVLMECETALYAPGEGTAQMQHTYKETISIISKLEELF